MIFRIFAVLFLAMSVIGSANAGYVGNDPINNVDPTGMYTCQSSDGESVECATEISQGISDIATSAQDGPTAAGRADSAELTAFYGDEGVDNGVVLTVGPLPSGATAQAGIDSDGTVTVTIAESIIGSGEARSQIAGTLGHEGRHGIDQRKMGNRAPQTRAEVMATERNANMSDAHIQQWARQPGGIGSFSGLLTLRNGSIDKVQIERNATASTAIFCAQSRANGQNVAGC